MARRTFDGKKARELREDKDITPLALVELIHRLTGRRWHPDTIRNVELGHTQPGLNLSHAWARALGIPRDELLDDAAPARHAVDVEVVTPEAESA
jgi:transcriptional regulator with XRE-family HTH domain